MNTKSSTADYIKGWIERGAQADDRRPASDSAGPIAIIGMDGRFPHCDSIEAFWQAIVSEKVLYGRYPADYLRTRAKRQGGGQPVVAGLIEAALDFDPPFFKISASEAELMDPQLRHLLMSVHRAIEDSGYTAKELSASRVGVFVGCEGSEYNQMHAASAAVAGYSLNHAGCSIANRVSYHFDFKGPSEAIDTMCSSGAYCIYRATELLRAGEIDIAVVGAVKMHFNEKTFEALDGLGMTSRKECHSFDRRSAGYVRSEGVVTLLLKRADEARRDLDVIYAKIRDVAVNFSGRDGSSMFTPSRRGQKDAMKRCFGKAGIPVTDVVYIEAQGMGNEISDFVEFNAINEACRELAQEQGVEAGQAGSFPVISTLKPMLGHMECVSALGALLRIILSLRTGTLFRIPGSSPHDIDPRLESESAPCGLLTTNAELGVRRTLLAGLNSFGASGTNVHILVERGEEQSLDDHGRDDLNDNVLVLSASSECSLRQYVADVHAFLCTRGNDVPIEVLCRSFQHRENYRHRLAVYLQAAPHEKRVGDLRERLLIYRGGTEPSALVWDNLSGSRHNFEGPPRPGPDGVPNTALMSATMAWLRGESVDWARHHDENRKLQKIGGLPTYPFDLKPYTVEGEAASLVPAGPRRLAAPVEAADSGDIKALIVASLSKSLKIGAEEIGFDTPFADYGVDSITGVNLIRALNESLRLELPTTALFDNSTVEKLFRYILCERALTGGRGGAGVPGAFSTRALPGNPAAVSKAPIAIIGMSGRFGESETLAEFWRNLRDGRNMVKEVSRWPREACMSSRQGRCTQGSFIDSIDRFDPFFFNISPLEALYMDPQQRLFLEESWKALEDAGYAGKSVDGKRCGVYTGCNFTDYPQLFDEEPPEQAFWGVAGCVIPARISYYLNLLGPAVMVDTACSSSLVAIHTACQGLWSGEIEMALAGAVFLQVTPMFFQYANRAGMLSAQGRCATFDAGADGFVPGEGVGVVVLKPLADALRDGDSIHGVIVGSGTNQDGKTNGITAPSASSQEQLECFVYDTYGIHPETIQVVEAHGTGTRLGDPIEFGALHRAFSRYTDKRQFCAIGSVKTNIGHTSAAAGMAGVLKILLSMKHQQLPPSLHFNEGNPLIDFASSPFYVNTRLQEWQAQGDQRRRAAISSFGFSGTNAHMVIEEGPALVPTEDRAPAWLIVLSAVTAEQLELQARNLLGFIEAADELSVNDMAYTLLVGRMHRSHRLSCVARSRAELIESLQRWLQSGRDRRVCVGEIQEGKVQEQVALRNYGNECIRQCRNMQDEDIAGRPVNLDLTRGVQVPRDQYLERLVTIAGLYVQGYELEFEALFPEGSRRIPLPTYPFARERFWIDEAASRAPPRATNHTNGELDSVIENLLAQIEEGALDADLGAQKLRALV